MLDEFLGDDLIEEIKYATIKGVAKWAKAQGGMMSTSKEYNLYLLAQRKHKLSLDLKYTLVIKRKDETANPEERRITSPQPRLASLFEAACESFSGVMRNGREAISF